MISALDRAPTPPATIIAPMPTSPTHHTDISTFTWIKDKILLVTSTIWHFLSVTIPTFILSLCCSDQAGSTTLDGRATITNRPTRAPIEGVIAVEDYQTVEAINNLLLAEVAPHYQTPFAAQATYRTSPENIFIISRPHYGVRGINHADYLRQVTAQEISIRPIHGLSHMLRCSIWAQIVLNILRPHSALDPRYKLLTILSAAFHDSAREDEGVDYWDDESGENFKRWLQQKFPAMTLSDALFWKESIAKKDEQPQILLARMTTHDADCLEILRCLGCNLTHFRKENLAISRHLSAQDLDALLQEVNAFIRHTENPSFKLQLEYHTERPYVALVELLRQYPTLWRYYSLTTEGALV